MIKQKNTRIILSFLFLIIVYLITGYISLKNLDKSRELSSKKTMVYQPSIILMNEMKLLIINSQNYINSWAIIDLSDHEEKIKLKNIHQKTYPELKLKIEKIIPKWNKKTHVNTIDSIINGYESALSSQKKIMSDLKSLTDYEDLIKRIEVENILEYNHNPKINSIIDDLDELLNSFKKEEAIENKKIQKSLDLIRLTNIIINIFVIIITIIISIILIQSTRLKEEKNKAIAERDEIEKKKKIIEQKNNEILESINYAKKIQKSILPSEQELKKHLENYFVFYQPKDIVSGDFYWLSKKPDSKDLFIAAADSTGHGVPGAFVSILASNNLNSSIKEHFLTQPSQILDKTRELIVENIGSSSSKDHVQDGMDIALCKINFDDLKIEFSGAYNSLYLVRDNKIIEYKASRQPVGAYNNASPFKNYSFDLHKNDCLYFFTDGFVDQFGGKKNKKYKLKPFLEFLLSIHQLTMEEQKSLLTKEFNDWKANEDQIDDVLVIGIKV